MSPPSLYFLCVHKLFYCMDLFRISNCCVCFWEGKGVIRRGRAVGSGDHSYMALFTVVQILFAYRTLG